MIYHKGQFYCLIVEKFGFLGFQGLAFLNQFVHFENIIFGFWKARIPLELSVALLNISRFYKAEGGDTFEVFEIDVSKVGLKEIHTLGDYAVFLGLNGAICIDFFKFTEVKSNHIYFVNGDGRDLRAYNIEDGKVESCYHGESRSYLCPPTWVIPSL
ncbi:hypothetical protein FXO37_00321 [Capsicum annuum]|nr:hypothetical protein FXO37_00321 [Capsicum annuum]